MQHTDDASGSRQQESKVRAGKNPEFDALANKKESVAMPAKPKIVRIQWPMGILMSMMPQKRARAQD